LIITKTIKFLDDDGNIESVKVEKYLGNSMMSKFTIKLGSELIIKPFSHKGYKNKGRKVKVVSFVTNEKSSLRVDVKYLDNGRRGKVEIEDLEKN